MSHAAHLKLSLILAVAQALLFRPVQRMCLYPLLFKRMVNCTSEGLPLHKLCEQAFNGVQQLNAEVNENVRNMESKLHMMEARDARLARMASVELDM